MEFISKFRPLKIFEEIDSSRLIITIESRSFSFYNANATSIFSTFSQSPEQAWVILSDSAGQFSPSAIASSARISVSAHFPYSTYSFCQSRIRILILSLGESKTPCASFFFLITFLIFPLYIFRFCYFSIFCLPPQTRPPTADMSPQPLSLFSSTPPTPSILLFSFFLLIQSISAQLHSFQPSNSSTSSPFSHSILNFFHYLLEPELSKPRKAHSIPNPSPFSRKLCNFCDTRSKNLKWCVNFEDFIEMLSW